MLDIGGCNLFVLYGSQGGTAEDVAERIAREGMQKFGLRPLVSSMDDFGVPKLASEKGDRKLFIFIAATTGQGDTPDNMKGFWRTLCRAQWGPDFLSGLNFGVIGLGDSSYEKYNFVGKKLFRRLKQLGANPLADLCLGDDQHDLGYHAAVSPWTNKIWGIITNQHWDLSQSENGEGKPLSKFIISEEGETNSGLELEDGERQCQMEMRKVVSNVRVTADDHWQETRLITIDLQNSALSFVPGDVLTVQPSNLPKNVETFFEIFPDLKNSPPIRIHKNPKMPWSKISPEILKIMGPQPWSWSEIVNQILDIQSVPRLYFFELMSKFAENELEKEKLVEFCTPEGQEDLFSYCNRPRRHILEVLQDFPNTTRSIPPIFLFDLIPAIKPRSFSIASSRKQFPNEVQILVAIVEYQTKIKAKRLGLCSNWFAKHCPSGKEIPVWMQKGSFTFPPENEDTSVIMIGPGTGVAPFRSIISERKDSWNKWLFFGCRNETSDFYFKEEWEQLSQQKKINFISAFSRDKNGRKRDYVQDKLLQESGRLHEIFASKNFYIYVAGNAKQMPKDVHAAILQILKDIGFEDADNFLEHCSKRLGRYQTETWS